MLIIYRGDIQIPFLDQEHYENEIVKNASVVNKTQWVKYTKWDEDVENYKEKTLVQMTAMYKELVNVSNCYICTHLPTTTQGKSNYTQIPLTEYIACNLLNNMFGREVKGTIKRRLKKEKNRGKRDSIIANWVSTLAAGKMPSMEEKSGIAYLISVLQADSIRPTKTSVEEGTEGKGMNTCGELTPKAGEKELLDAFNTGRDKGRTQGGTSMEMSSASLAIHKKKKAPGCFQYHKGSATTTDNSSIKVGRSSCNKTSGLANIRNDSTGLSIGLTAPKGIFIICGSSAYFRLPAGWQGTCYLAFVLPRIVQVTELPQDKKKNTWEGTQREDAHMVG
ncbi:hypothetical protein NDU88_003180 [Pleurodeles waltl]|uniref:Uncharacterized protein n=1 Tax=Pleurodeles waltl TaxID=8319 RepID=A0AAV7LHV9_PLEWA|nr:hypothetical protein NDU88_003180 [Pleurodeles waltl]